MDVPREDPSLTSKMEPQRFSRSNDIVMVIVRSNAAGLGTTHMLSYIESAEVKTAKFVKRICAVWISKN